MGSGKGDQAVAIFRDLRAERPDDADLLSAERAVLAHGIPQWHAKMLSDFDRNDCYERALIRAVRPDSIVLDIGSGSGLLAMMAARAGARHVYTCEAVPAVAETAREIIAANGFADRVTVLSRHSSDLNRKRDLGGGADILVSEIIADNLLSEGVIASLAHAARELARPGALFIPCKASMRVALAWFDQPHPQLPAVVSGFDVSLFDRHVATHHSVLVGHKRLHLRSNAQEMFPLSFGESAPTAPTHDHAVLRAEEGPVNAMVQWVHLQMDDAEAYENAPAADASSAWGAVLHRFPDALCGADVREIAVHGDHDGVNPRFWFARG
ncbi:MAG TPA: 50S ribosomal protein L11 methyltransferase [Allosphingosinicella sp.]|jgi:type II protein arginine methyltransferase|uniref:50S ribosomal protein L11 methyltransferase n=1 Tax=Allosphingosinicella sp. TaxID=2823234 RepID=UPI002F2833A1